MVNDFKWKYQKLGDFTYNVLPQSQIKPFLMRWLKREWEIDHAEFPDQVWTVEWLKLLPQMDFTLEIIKLIEVQLRQDLMAYKKESYEFISELRKRADERQESLRRGVSLEPLVVNGNGMELMDGYTRYILLQKYQQDRVYAYVGRVV